MVRAYLFVIIFIIGISYILNDQDRIGIAVLVDNYGVPVLPNCRNSNEKCKENTDCCSLECNNNNDNVDKVCK